MKPIAQKNDIACKQLYHLNFTSFLIAKSINFEKLSSDMRLHN